MSKSRRKSYIPSNDPSKRYSSCMGKIERWYLHGGFKGNGKPLSCENEIFSRLIRHREKREWKHRINEELCV